VIESGAIVDGAVDLGEAAQVSGLFRCERCTFRGEMAAEDATFARTIDLTGSTFRGPVDFRGTTFRGPALFRASPSGSGARALRFRRRSDFSLTVFQDTASFSGTEFDGPAEFRDAKLGDVTFANAVLNRTAVFDGATFGAARLDGAEFSGPATFSESEFDGRTNFSLASFESGAIFTGANFAEGASFLAAQFTSAPSTEEAARFDGVTSNGDLDLTFVELTVGGGPYDHPPVIASFSDLVCSGALLLRRVEFPNDAQLSMDQLQVRDLVMDVHVVDLVQDSGQGERRNVLQEIEASGKSRGDLSIANDAEYRLRIIKSRSYGTVGHALDYVFYRGVAGYFVRPLRPIVVLFGLAAVIAAVVELRRRGVAGRFGRRAGQRIAGFLTSFLDTLALVGPRRGEGKPRLSGRLLAFTFRLLAVCALLGLANSNPTLRQMVDTLF
jgi:uncharacterized protein YjbI with pentapeptide repeats